MTAAGFIQGEMGTLIPVYHPEALSQYLNPEAVTNGTVQGQPVATIAYATNLHPPNVAWHAGQYPNQQLHFPGASGNATSPYRINRVAPQQIVPSPLGSQPAAGINPVSWTTPVQLTNFANAAQLQPIATSAIPLNQATEWQSYQHLRPTLATISPAVGNSSPQEQPTYNARYSLSRGATYPSPTCGSNLGSNAQSSPSSRSNRSGSGAYINTPMLSRDCAHIQ